jgi:hypothetical protein
MEELLEKATPLAILRDFWTTYPNKPVAAICHGVLLMARSGLLGSVHTTGLPRWLEAQAYYLTKYAAGLGGYQLKTTYGEYTEDEILRKMKASQSAHLYVHSPFDPLAPLLPGTSEDHSHAFIHEDGRYVSGRFWGDAFMLAQRLAAKLND